MLHGFKLALIINQGLHQHVFVSLLFPISTLMKSQLGLAANKEIEMDRLSALPVRMCITC